MSGPGSDLHGVRAADAIARARAQREFARPLLLEAGAGTGKTSVLVTRVLAWCLGPGWARAAASLAMGAQRSDAEAIAGRVLDRVVAVTFTEAAAAEMEERIARGLRALGAPEGAEWPTGLERESVPADPALRSARARALLTSFDRLRVSTIHAFCRRLLAEHPVEAGVHPRFAVDATGMARAVAARAAVETWLFDPARADDPDLFALVEGGIAAPELEAMLDALLAAAIEPERFAADPLAPERIVAFTARLRAAVGGFLAAEDGRLRGLRGRSLGREAAEAATATASLLAAPPVDAARLTTFVDELAALWPENLRGRLTKLARRNLGKSERAAVADREEALSAAAAALEPILRHAVALDPARLARVHRVLTALHGAAAARMRNEGAESFDALLRRAGALVSRHPEVSTRVRGRIDQLLVDEFQDTDAVQCELVARLALDDAGGTRPGLFVVGDPKQSIYGWRNADLAAYEGFRERLEAAGGEVHPLAVNYRSTRQVLEEVERVVRPVMRAARGEQPPFEPLLASRDEAGPPVEYWIASDWVELCGGGTTLLGKATEREAMRLAADLLRISREAREGGVPLSWCKVGILLRTTSDVEVYLAALRGAGIPYTVTRDRQYARRREVVEARALVRAVLDPGDQIALVATLRAAWAGVPDAAWRPLWRHGFPDAMRDLLDGRAGARGRLAGTLRAAADETARAAAGIPGFAALGSWSDALLHAAEVLAALRRSFALEPAERFVERLRTLPMLAGGEAARFLGPWRLANLQRFFRELARAFEDARGDGAAVLRALRREDAVDADWDEGRPARPGDDAVQVMSIHGAKGLEFEHVYLLQLHKGESSGRPEPFRSGEGALASEWCFGDTRVATLDFDRVQTARRRVEEHERVRTLYVAMTRAKRRLVLSGHWSPGAVRGVHGGLLAKSRGEALAEALAAGAGTGAGWEGTSEHDGARWVFLDRAPVPDERPLESAGAGLIAEAQVRAESAGLAARRVEAAKRARRPLAAGVTAAIAAREAEVEGFDDEERVRRRPPSPADQVASAAVGTAIHALLERLDVAAAEPEAEWQRRREEVHAVLEGVLSPESVPRARARADALLERLRGGRLWIRLREIAPDVVARELPVLIEPEDGLGPVGAGVGAIDLVYRDPVRGFVVVDFKTDRIEGARGLAERIEHHRAQGNAYRRAVAGVLGTEAGVRCELWFLDADAVVELDG